MSDSEELFPERSEKSYTSDLTADKYGGDLSDG